KVEDSPGEVSHEQSSIYGIVIAEAALPQDGC
ncbi:unnamed protein product, partial [marine sediment metagenome]